MMRHKSTILTVALLLLIPLMGFTLPQLAILKAILAAGIDPKAQRVIFEPFRQGSSSVNQQYGGVGLGLYIVRTLVRRLGGRVRVRDHETGPGAVFEVELPGGLAIAQEAPPHEDGRLTEEPEVA